MESRKWNICWHIRDGKNKEIKLTKEQEDIFWDTMRVLNELDILENVVVMGSWAEYLYQDIFGKSYKPLLKTRDIDLMYKIFADL